VVVVEERVLVVDLDHRHTRVGAVGQPRVGIDPRQQLARVRLFGGDRERIEEADPFGKTRHVQVHVDVDAAFLERSDQVILAVNVLRIELELFGRVGRKGFRHRVALAVDAGPVGHHE
jgi:hypothetical protein